MATHVFAVFAEKIQTFELRWLKMSSICKTKNCGLMISSEKFSHVCDRCLFTKYTPLTQFHVLSLRLLVNKPHDWQERYNNLCEVYADSCFTFKE